MIELNTKIKLEALVVKMMSEGKSFTSLDIANIVKDDGIWVRNTEVAIWLRKNAITIGCKNSKSYNQSLIIVDSSVVGFTHTYLYHHFETSPDEYLDRDQKPKNPNNLGNSKFMFSKTKIEPSVTQPTKFFRTRELARVFSRKNNDYKIKDEGKLSKKGHRWTCVLSN